jgi:hypothetical protein
MFAEGLGGMSPISVLPFPKIHIRLQKMEGNSRGLGDRKVHPRICLATTFLQPASELRKHPALQLREKG